ncbi:MAG TPA: dihydropteroate synthase [Candidatus Margulisiibacteriota bacterium]|nr:dihydropteroate synthase [Candidatus Margulisiibacteriota bacterium]
MRLHANLAGIDVGDGFPVRLVGAINISPESFYSGSVAQGRRGLQRLAQTMVAEGADLLDIGAMSTAPYVKGAIVETEERKRMTAAVRAVRQVVTVPISVDTQRSSVAAAALDAGAAVINDVSGLRHDAAMGTVARHAAGVILMASEEGASREPPMRMVASLLRGCLRRARSSGVDRRRIVLDPGIGFFRRAALPWYEFDCVVLSQLSRLRRLRRPLLVGLSRKSFIGKLSGRTGPAERLPGSLAATAIAVYNGAALIRTHDVGATRDAVRIASALRAAGESDQ